jgi:membrane associated rhomboid family serine protease
MVRAIIVSNRKWITAGLIVLGFIAAVVLVTFLSIAAHEDAEAGWDAWGTLHGIIPAVVASLHARFTQRPALNPKKPIGLGIDERSSHK